MTTLRSTSKGPKLAVIGITCDSVDVEFSYVREREAPIHGNLHKQKRYWRGRGEERWICSYHTYNTTLHYLGNGWNGPDPIFYQSSWKRQHQHPISDQSLSKRHPGTLVSIKVINCSRLINVSYNDWLSSNCIITSRIVMAHLSGEYCWILWWMLRKLSRVLECAHVRMDAKLRCFFTNVHNGNFTEICRKAELISDA